MSRTTWPKCENVRIRNRVFTQHDLVLIRKLIRSNPSWGRTRLSQEVCNRLNWMQPNGRTKERACRVALLKLEANGYLQLPRKKIKNGGQRPITVQYKLPPKIYSEMPDKLQICEVLDSKGRTTWNNSVASFHYLGLPTPVGRLIRYLVFSDCQSLLASISFSEPAWSVNARKNALQLFDEQIDERAEVVSNNRFLILPNVKIKNLASRILGELDSRIVKDWQTKYGIKPRVAETFVDPARFLGTCYKASNWQFVGTTKGFKKSGASHNRTEQPKMLFLKGLEKSLNKQLIENFRSVKTRQKNDPGSTRIGKARHRAA